MILYDCTKNLKMNGPTACALGNFDGIHLGHQGLISQVIKTAEDLNAQSTIVTFQPHPLKVLGENTYHPLIMTMEKKRMVMREFGIKNMICIPFTLEFSNMNYRDFVYDILLNRCKAKAIVTGEDYRFGHKGEGNVGLLKEICLKEDVDVIVVDSIYYNGGKISSTLIRNIIKNGDVKTAMSLLGRPFSIEGIVVPGDALGRQLGFPTANVSLSEDTVLPQTGVYAVIAYCCGKKFKGVANLGYKPTFNGDEVKLEVHLFDFDDEIYGKSIEVHFIKNLRKEIKFKDPLALVRQVNMDFTVAKAALAEL